MEIFMKSWLPVIVWSGVIFTFSSIPYLSVPSMGLNFEDKIYHCAEFLIWGLLFMRACASSKISEAGSFLFLVLAGVVFAALDECHQHWVPGREFDWKDLVSNWAGLAVSAIIWMVAKK